MTRPVVKSNLFCYGCLLWRHREWRRMPDKLRKSLTSATTFRCSLVLLAASQRPFPTRPNTSASTQRPLSWSREGRTSRFPVRSFLKLRDTYTRTAFADAKPATSKMWGVLLRSLVINDYVLAARVSRQAFCVDKFS